MTETGTRQRTFDHATWLRARDAWDAGEFSPEWADWRLLASRRGIIFPPDGTRWDSVGDARPSQRAILIRAIRETPVLLRQALETRGVGSWGDVIGILLGGLREWGLEADLREHEWHEVKARKAPEHVGATLATIMDSLGVER